MSLFQNFLAKAKALTSQGKLMEATRAIQHGLGFDLQAEVRPKPGPDPAAKDAPLASEPAAPSPRQPQASVPPDVSDIAFRETARPASELPSAGDIATLAPSSFTLGFFEHGPSRYAYRLFIPTRADASPLPLVVMLHGCKQDADDFAKGTAMNGLAEREKFMVLYPEQLRKANSMGCWNWFDPAHQASLKGEPAMIAALSSRVMAAEQGDTSRMYVAGLSAGAAMAALVGQLHPQTFAAVGVHSGLAPGAASDVASAFSAMSRGPGPAAKVSAIGVPVIVFQGTGDATVAPGNADAIIQSELSFWSSKGVKLAKSTGEENAAGTARAATRSVWRNEDQKPLVELWSVNAGPHAWSGGDTAGSFTDPKGPSASRAMFEFFKAHAKTPA